MTAQDIYDFLNDHELAVIATVSSEGMPESAVIGFGQTKHLELLFGTDNTTRKYQNLLTNPMVAVVIGWDEGRTIQYEGTARELAANELKIVKDNYWAKAPEAEAYADYPGERYFLVTPTWIRYTDTNTDPETVFQFDLSNMRYKGK